ncbi:MAG: hypothetical protein EBW53_03570, partial [Actinobacteria bacterium]|nr:hypothetical protein [Actinomycetota bacterium]
WQGQSLDLSVSLGVAHWPEHALDTEALLRRAELQFLDQHATVLQHTFGKKALCECFRVGVGGQKVVVAQIGGAAEQGDTALRRRQIKKWTVSHRK